MDFCTLGMFIIDEIHFPPPRPPVQDVIGGAGTYAVLGARLFSPSKFGSAGETHPYQGPSRSVGWIVDVGEDFPPFVRQEIEAWNTGLLMRQRPKGEKTTRGWNGYRTGDHGQQRAFEYTTPKLRLDHNSLDDRLITSKSFHMVCSADRCVDLTSGLNKRRKLLNGQSDCAAETPLYIWEPVPDLCIKEELSKFAKPMTMVHVVSPNHNELMSLFGEKVDDTSDDADARSGGELESKIIELAHKLYQMFPADRPGAVVVRVGRKGCYTLYKDIEFWLPSVHSHSPEKAVDPTGGGNAFLGALAVGLARLGLQSIYETVILASVAASFAIEQVGTPSLDVDLATGMETWNETHVDQRVQDFQRRVAAHRTSNELGD